MGDGDYRLTIPGGTLPNQSAAYQYDFFVLAGDVNRDRQVSFVDLITVAANFGKTGATAAEGDLNGDGQISFVDLIQVSSKFGNLLPPIPVAAPAPLAAAASAAPRQVKAKTIAAKKPAPRAVSIAPTFSVKRVKRRDVVWK
jgi:hypothetical protein